MLTATAFTNFGLGKSKGYVGVCANVDKLVDKPIEHQLLLLYGLQIKRRNDIVPSWHSAGGGRRRAVCKVTSDIFTPHPEITWDWMNCDLYPSDRKKYEVLFEQNKVRFNSPVRQVIETVAVAGSRWSMSSLLSIAMNSSGEWKPRYVLRLLATRGASYILQP